MKLFIYGVPGAGKTAFATHLREYQLPWWDHWEFVEADNLREKLQKDFTKSEHPFLYLGTSQAYKEFGDRNRENIIKGLSAVRSELRSAVLEEVASKSGNLLMEGAFLEPAQLAERGVVVLVITKDEARHAKQFFTHRERTKESEDEFLTARMIQEYLRGEAKDKPVLVVDNDREMVKVAWKILKRLSEYQTAEVFINWFNKQNLTDYSPRLNCDEGGQPEVDVFAVSAIGEPTMNLQITTGDGDERHIKERRKFLDAGGVWSSYVLTEDWIPEHIKRKHESYKPEQLKEMVLLIDSSYAIDDDPEWLRKKIGAHGISKRDFKGVYIVIRGNVGNRASVMPIKEVVLPDNF